MVEVFEELNRWKRVREIEDKKVVVVVDVIAVAVVHIVVVGGVVAVVDVAVVITVRSLGSASGAWAATCHQGRKQPPWNQPPRMSRGR